MKNILVWVLEFSVEVPNIELNSAIDIDVAELSMDEKLALKEEFLHTMQERFLSGNDKEFDYR